MRHYVVQEWIDAGGEEVGYAGDVSESHVQTHEQIIALEGLVHYLSVNRHDTLCMKRRPAEEESDDDGDWNRQQMVIQLSRSVSLELTQHSHNP